MSLNQTDREYHELSQATIATTSIFLKNYEQARQTASTINAFDSCFAVEGSPVENTVPAPLIALFDSIGKDNDQARNGILQALSVGIEGYKARNGGDMPRADIVASALTAGKLAFDEYDSANGTQLNSGGHESNSVVPSATIVTIATRIANALPLMAYLPNTNGSNEVPIVYGRNVAKNTYGELKAGDYLDGAGASLQYFDPQFEFSATVDGANDKLYTVTPRICYADNQARTPDANAKVLPFIGGRVRIYVNGVEVANDATNDHAKFEGASTIVPVRKHGLTIAGEAVKVVSGEANLSTGLISFIFANALPAGTEVFVNVIADYERKVDGVPVLAVPSVDIDLIARKVYAYPMRAIYRATTDAVNQMQRELGLDIRGAVSAVVAGKFMLEQNIALLKKAKRRAIGLGRQLTADLSRGATDIAVFNNTAEQARELLVTVSIGKVLINKILDIVPSGHDIYVTDKMSVVFDNLADDTHYRKISNSVGSPNAITRIGQIDGNINVYHVPLESNLLKEEADIADIMLIGRSSEAVRNPFVGFISKALTVRETLSVDFEEGVAIHGTQCCELNPLDRFADQVVVIEVTNLPASVASV